MGSLGEHRAPDGSVVRLRAARADDAQGLRALDLAIAQDGRGVVLGPEQIRTVEQERTHVEGFVRDADDASLFALAERDGEVVGSASLRQMRGALIRHVGVLAVGVHPEHQRLGIGRALMEALVAHAEHRGLTRLELYVRADNPRARALYRGLGFEEEAVRRAFVRTPEGAMVDDIIMVRFLG